MIFSGKKTFGNIIWNKEKQAKQQRKTKFKRSYCFTTKHNMQILIPIMYICKTAYENC